MRTARCFFEIRVSPYHHHHGEHHHRGHPPRSRLFLASNPRSFPPATRRPHPRLISASKTIRRSLGPGRIRREEQTAHPKSGHQEVRRAERREGRRKGQSRAGRRLRRENHCSFDIKNVTSSIPLPCSLPEGRSPAAAALALQRLIATQISSAGSPCGPCPPNEHHSAPAFNLGLGRNPFGF